MSAEDELEIAKALLIRVYNDYLRLDVRKNIIAFAPWPLSDDIAKFLGKEKFGCPLEKDAVNKAKKKEKKNEPI